MPTTSIAFFLTNMKPVTSADNRVRVFHTNSKTAESLLQLYSTYFLAVEEQLEVQNEFKKLDVVYVPNLNTPTITKWGLIAVSGELNPIQNSVVDSLDLKNNLKAISRSVYQLFFGQLISPEWWNDLWVTQGLSRFFGATSELLPFDAEKEFELEVVQNVTTVNTIFTDWRMEMPWYTLDYIDNPHVHVVDLRGEKNG